LEKIKELAELLLPEGILKYFEYEGYKKGEKRITITLVEKNKVPKLPAEYQNRKIRQKGFKEMTIDDFPLRGNKVKLRLRRRVWQIEGESKLFKREIEMTYPGTKLEKDFAIFFKGGD